ncbi:hypothetical protein C8Q77DRAFT_1156081 [Trametes polyzona]|nr:hypothetical protein C8Q77DRAFT_1156081 [Trametes polyzona]
MQRLFVLAALSAAGLAQQAIIVSPTPGTLIGAGQQVTVAVHQDASTTNTTQGGIVIGFRSCESTGTTDCSTFDPATQGVGSTIVFAGAFDPKEDPNQPQKGSFQDFTFTVPANNGIGGNVFTLGHFQTVGANNVPQLNFSTVIVNVL